MIRLAFASFATGALGFLALFVPAALTTTPAHWAWVVGRPSPYSELSHSRKRQGSTRATA